MYQFDFRVLLPYAPAIAQGALLTFEVTALALAISLPLGLVGALIRLSKWRVARAAVAAYVELFRNLPLLVVLYVLFFVLPAHGVRLNAFQAGVTGLTLNSAAFTVEIFRGGFSSIPHGQYEAATALGIRPYLIFLKVIFPQLFTVVFPALGNQVVSVVLGSSEAAIIGVGELTYQSLTIGSDTFRYFEVFAVAGGVYVLFVQAFNGVWNVMGRRLVGRVAVR